MKKGATLTSGILTIILFTILLFVSIFEVANVFKITFIQEIFENYAELNYVITIVSSLFITFPLALVETIFNLQIPELYSQIIVVVFAVFSLLMIIWGIKEIFISKKEDVNFAKCKKTCGFMMFTKFMFFAFLGASLALYFVLDEYKLLWDTNFALLKEITEIDFTMYFIIGLAVLALYALIIFLLPTINFAVAYKQAKKDGILDIESTSGEDNSGIQSYDGGEQAYAPQSTMQANMPPIPGYQPQYNTQPQQVAQPQPQIVEQPVNNVQQQPVAQPVAQPVEQPVIQQPQAVNTQPVNNVQPQAPVNQPKPAPQPQAPAKPKPVFATSEPQPSVQAQFNPQIQAEEALRASSITPGQNGVPLNITQKGIEGLERLERLRAGGMLTEENYQAMRQKIFTTDIA